MPPQQPPTDDATVQVRPPSLDRPLPPPPPAATPERNLDFDRYRCVTTIGRGGMGEVWHARDPVMERDLAIKVFRGDPGRNPDSAARFVEEARIAGHLQHPSVVPVYDLGKLADGRPFFTMKLIRGRTLAALLQTREQTGLPQVLKIFEQVCQAVAYAHSRGVIHRDLKPANIMVGEFGEVQVMDWGIAKLVGVCRLPSREETPPAAEDSTADTSDLSDTGSTVAGTVMGTFAYMPPEQALGQIEELDERCDVFALGAILCEILTGKPAYSGDTLAELQRAASGGELDDAVRRLGSCGEDHELIDLATDCLKPDKQARPRSAAVVAERADHYLNGVQEKLRDAELAEATALARMAEWRKRRRLSLAAAVSSVVLIGLATVSFMWRQSEHAEHLADLEQDREVARHRVMAALREARDLRAVGRWGEATVALQQAEGWLDRCDSSGLAEEVRAAGERLTLAQRLEQIRRDRYDLVGQDFQYWGATRAYAEAFAGAGLDPESDADAVAAKIRSSPIRRVLVTALDDWSALTIAIGQNDLRKRLLAIARSADPDPDFRDRVRDQSNWLDRDALERLAAEAPEHDAPAVQVQLIAGLLDNVGGDPVSLLQRMQSRHPYSFWLNFELANYLIDRSAADAVGYYRAALAVQPESEAVLVNLSVALAKVGRFEEAISMGRRAAELAEDGEAREFIERIVGTMERRVP